MVDQELLIREIRRIFAKASETGLRVWLTGGWAIQAQIQQPQRNQEDIDLAVEEGDLRRYKLLLEELGYELFKDGRESPLRPEFRLGEVKVQAASLRVGAQWVCMSVPDCGGNGWLRCPREGFPDSNDWNLKGRRVRCATPMALLYSKLSCELDQGHWKYEQYKQDREHLIAHLGLREEVDIYASAAKPITEFESSGCCPSSESES